MICKIIKKNQYIKTPFNNKRIEDCWHTIYEKFNLNPETKVWLNFSFYMETLYSCMLKIFWLIDENYFTKYDIIMEFLLHVAERTYIEGHKKRVKEGEYYIDYDG